MVCTTLAATHHWFPGVLGRAFGKSKNDLFVNLQSGTLRVCKLDGEGELANCIVGSASSTACASDVLLLCAPGDSCFQNQQNVAYCCAAGHFGCSDVCVDSTLQRSILATQGSCNGVAPQGVRIPGHVIAINTSWWDPKEKRYDFRSRSVAINDGPVSFDTGDFTLRVTVTPVADGRVTLLGNGVTGATFATFMTRLIRPPDPTTSVGISFGVIDFRSPFQRNDISFQFLAGNLTAFDPETGNGGRQLLGTLPESWRANIPQELRAIRRGTMLYIFANGELIASDETEAVFDVGRGFQSPFVIGAAAANETVFPSFLDCYLSDISVSNTADFP